MSFILDALKRSEQQRRLGEMPSLADSGAIQAVNNRRRSRAIWIVLLLLPLLAVGWWFYSGPGSDRPVSNADSVPATTGQTEEPVRDIASPGLAASGTTPIPENDARSQLDANPRTPTPVELYEARARRPASAAVASEPPDATSLDDEAPAREEPAPTDDLLEAGMKPLRFNELPAGIREDLGQLKVTLQVHDKEPANRFAIVNSRRLREGDELQPGLMVEEILTRGVVLIYRDYRFIIGD